MKRNSDRLLKILIVLATLIILGTLATLAFLNFSAEEKRNDRSETTTSARLVTSSTNSTSTTEESSSSSSVTSKAPARTTVARTTSAQPTEPVKTQAKLTLEEAIKENANEGRGEPATTAGSKTFRTQAEAHEYGLAETTRIGTEEKKAAFYVIEAVRDSSGKVTGWEVKITIN